MSLTISVSRLSTESTHIRPPHRYAYIPLLPVAIQGLVSDAPMPLLVGMHTANVEQGIYAQDEAVVVDVDRDKIRSIAHARAVTPLPQYAPDIFPAIFGCHTMRF